MSVATLTQDFVDSNVSRRERLRDIIAEKSFSNDRVVKLSSGRQSTLYFNMKPTMMDNEASYLIANEILDLLPADARYVGGLEMGAVPIVSALCPVAHMRSHDVKTFFVRKKAKDHGARKLVEGLASEEELKGAKVVVVDDVTTTGGSVVSTFATLKDLGAEILMVVSIVDRQEGAVELFNSEGIPFTSLFTARDFI